MQSQEQSEQNLMPQSEVNHKIGMSRMLIGLVQGAVLYFLYETSKSHQWPANEPLLFAPMLLVFVLLPVLLITALGHLKPSHLWPWMVLYVIVIAGLSMHDVWRGNGLENSWSGSPKELEKTIFPSALLIFFSIAGCFIAHSFLLASAQDQRRIASYPTHFELAWKLLIQMKFSALFVIALFLVLRLGAALFMLVKLNFLNDLLDESWFLIPVSAFSFSCAMHITDVRPAIVRGIRGLLLVLMSWILPVAVLIVGGFLLSLIGTGLQPLWATRHATAVLLSSAGVLIVLINAAFQNGEVSTSIAWLLRLSARIAACLLLPISTIAVIALVLRVREYGWSSDRVIAAACLCVAIFYTLGYGWAAISSRQWMPGIAKVNVWTAFLILGVLIALFSPIADPARIAVSNQLNRLNSGQVSADQFDYTYLRFEGGRYGKEALQQLQNRTEGKDAAIIRSKASVALQSKNRWAQAIPVLAEADIKANIQIWPNSALIPPAFLQQISKAHDAWESVQCLDHKNAICDAYLLDLTHDSKPEIILIGREPKSGSAVYIEDPQGIWTLLANLPNDIAGCETLRKQLQAGHFHATRTYVDDIQIGEQQISVNQYLAYQVNMLGKTNRNQGNCPPAQR